MTAPYARLAELALLESRLVGDNRLEELAPLQAERDAIVAALPETPPADARPYLVEAQAALRATQALLEAELSATRDELASVTAGRRAATGYAAASRPADHDLELSA